MNKLKLIFLISTLTTLFACSPSPTKKAKTDYLKDNISQTELANRANYKRYHYLCSNFETGTSSYLSSYFPLSRESRMKDNFGFYFQLDGGKIEPFDHIENKTLNARGSRFEVTYRSYNPIQGSYVDLIAREQSSAYYRNINGVRVPWLNCRES
ncbi:hypothetical protein [Actinobacillus suis]|uniref:Lipoprotein n=2 Tax=Actinobacillus suis TaxID=716 RepID=K0G7B2_ACTSU|nr:hypothetical protein [Actinobacillus suis]AFU20281.1 hypothetical protein ASU2_10765 [Actinobacillus suis H91-0380]AIJ32413.1 hypothetical protein ASU1_10790 [Actinobacillus suis ATCC 33415]MCO4167653.1 hypothetical protein [Actinobacillus suis]MCO4169634.1 hypothetical protein [Actinobacillus suis]MCQ9630248.1 hypothetical protein [Actinobacillus suis]